jgi:hypothetical protein
MDQPDLGAGARAPRSLRRCVRVVGWPAEPLADSAGRIRRRHLGERAFLRGARRAGDPRTHARRGGRRARRRGGRAGCGRQLPVLAVAVRWRGRCDRKAADDRSRDLHDHRRDATRLLWRRRRTDVRRRDPDRNGAARAWQGERARHAVELVAQRHVRSRASRSRRRRRPCAASSIRSARARFHLSIANRTRGSI